MEASSHSPQRRGPKRRRTEDWNVEADDSAAGPSLPKRVSTDRQMPRREDLKSAKVLVRDIRFAKMLMDESQRIGYLEEIGLYVVPLTRSSNEIGPATLNRFVFDVGNFDENDQSLPLDRIRENKTILLVGAPGKTSLINNLFNFILGVDWNDPFRFLLKEDGQEETDSISVYEIRHANGFRIPFSFTIVDLPVCYDTPPHDFTETMIKIFQDKDTVQQLDLIGFVARGNTPPSKSCDSFLSFFGKDLKENLHCLLTFDDLKQKTPLSNTFLESLPRHQFQNLEFLSRNGRNDPSLRRNQWKAFEGFFQSLAKMDPNRLSQTRQVLEERHRLEVTFGELRKLVENGTALQDKIKQTKKRIANYQAKIEENIYDIETTRKKNLSDGNLATNCNKCRVTCSVHQKFETEAEYCSVCPEKCNWNLHSINVSYQLESTVENVPLKLETYSENLEKLITEERNNSINQKVLRCQVAVYIKELDNIALRPFVTTPEYADLIV